MSAGSNRGSFEVYADVLLVLRHNALNQTRVMYQADLSHTPLIRVLSLLEEKRLVVRTGKKYTITQSGFEVSAKMEELRGLLNLPSKVERRIWE